MAEFESWSEKMREKILSGDRSDPMVKEMDTEMEAGEKPFQPVQFAQVDRALYAGEVGRKGSDFIFHFFPPEGGFPPNFEDCMGDAFLEVFKFPERVQAAYMDELSSWAVKCIGFASNPLSDQLASRVFDELDRRLAT